MHNHCHYLIQGPLRHHRTKAWANDSWAHAPPSSLACSFLCCSLGLACHPAGGGPLKGEASRSLIDPPLVPLFIMRPLFLSQAPLKCHMPAKGALSRGSMDGATWPWVFGLHIGELEKKNVYL